MIHAPSGIVTYSPDTGSTIRFRPKLPQPVHSFSAARASSRSSLCSRNASDSARSGSMALAAAISPSTGTSPDRRSRGKDSTIIASTAATVSWMRAGASSTSGTTASA